MANVRARTASPPRITSSVCWLNPVLRISSRSGRLAISFRSAASATAIFPESEYSTGVKPHEAQVFALFPAPVRFFAYIAGSDYVIVRARGSGDRPHSVECPLATPALRDRISPAGDSASRIIEEGTA
jgi:hypothetical protein